MDHASGGLTAAAHGANDTAPAPAQASTQEQQIPCLFSKQFGSLAAPPQQVMEALPTIALRHRTSSQDSTYTAPSASAPPVGAIKPLPSLAGFGGLLHQDSLTANNMQHCSLAAKLASSPSLQQQEQQPQQLAAGRPERSAATLFKQQPAEAAAAASPGFSSAAQAAAQLMPFQGAQHVAAGDSQQQQQQQQAAQPAAAPAAEGESPAEGLAMRASSDGDDGSTDDGGCADMDHLDDVAAAEILIGLRSASLQQSNSGWGSGTDSDGEAAPAAAGTSPAAAAAAGAGLHRHHSGGINLFAPSSTLAAHLAAAESGHSFVMHPARADPAAAAAAAVGFGPLQGRFSLGSSSSRHASLPGSSPSHGHHGMASSYGGSPLLVRTSTSAGGRGSSSSGRGMHEYGALGSPAHSALMHASPAAATATPSPRRGSHSRHPDCKCQKACKPHEACHACGATHSPGESTSRVLGCSKHSPLPLVSAEVAGSKLECLCLCCNNNKNNRRHLEDRHQRPPHAL
jgi:hypothetical protein